MISLVIIGWTLIGLVAGAMLGGELADLAANHRGDIGALWGGSIIGAVSGAICGGFLGRMLALKYAGNLRMLKALTGATWIGPLLVASGVIAYQQIADSLRNPELVRADGRGLSLIYELRLPAGTQAPKNAAGIQIELRTPGDVKAADSARVLDQDGRVVIQGHFWIIKATPNRVVAVSTGDGSSYLFTMHLAARPADRGGQWSKWQGPDEVSGAAQRPKAGFEIRYAVNY